MSTVLFKALAFLVMMALGFGAKRSGLLQQKDSRCLMAIVINITMPAALLSGFRDFSLDPSLGFAIVLGFGFNLVLMLFGWVCSRGHRPDARALYLLNLPSYNIGNFVLPFVQGFFPSSAVLCLSMFDAGNNPIGTGIAYSVASAASGGEARISPRDMVRKLFHSPPFLCYFIMMLIYLAGLRLPAAFFDFCQMFGQGNYFLAMFTLGLIFELQLPQEDAREVWRILLLRYGLCLIGAAGVFFLTPYSLLVRQTLALCLVGPVTTLSIPYGLACGCRQSMIGALSSLSILISFLLTIGLLLLWA